MSDDSRARTAWLDAGVEPHPSRYGPTRAGRLRVPEGWRLIDRRPGAVILPSPAAR